MIHNKLLIFKNHGIFNAHRATKRVVITKYISGNRAQRICDSQRERERAHMQHHTDITDSACNTADIINMQVEDNKYSPLAKINAKDAVSVIYVSFLFVSTSEM